MLLQLNNLDYLKIEWMVRNASYVHTNQVVAEVTYTIREIRERFFSSHEEAKTYSFKIPAPSDGFLYIQESEKDILYRKNDGAMSWECTEPEIYENVLQKLAFVFQSMPELFAYHYQTGNAVLEVDPYTDLHTIKWERYIGRYILSDEGCTFWLDFINDKAVFVINYYERLRKGDCISLLFEGNHIVDYLIQNTPTKNDLDESFESHFTLYKEDVDLLLNHELVSYRITYLNNRFPTKTETILFSYLGHGLFEEASTYVKCYLEALDRLVPSYRLPQRSIIENPKENSFNWCYVYLMKDTSNGYYKIGISNTPEYRERTLQSEKPTIEMLACKKYPTRKIAESIESALHTTYSQQRLRGEWFNLNDADVAAIIETLK